MPMITDIDDKSLERESRNQNVYASVLSVCPVCVYVFIGIVLI